MSQIRTNSIVPSGGVPAGADGGGIIQVVENNTTDYISIAPGSNFSWSGNISQLATSITPRSASNKILIILTIVGSGDNEMAIRLLRGGTVIGSGASDGTNTAALMAKFTNYGDNGRMRTYTHRVLDSPGTTSAVTYNVQGWRYNTGSTFVLNRSVRNNYNGDFATRSGMVLMEVSG